MRPSPPRSWPCGASAKDTAFYTGKIAAARHFAAEVLPQVSVARSVADGVTLDVMDLPEEAF